jgi:hypothetical protein
MGLVLNDGGSTQLHEPFMPQPDGTLGSTNLVSRRQQSKSKKKKKKRAWCGNLHEQLRVAHVTPVLPYSLTQTCRPDHRCS